MRSGNDSTLAEEDEEGGGLSSTVARNVARVKRDLGITEGGLKSDAAALKHWLHRQPHLMPINIAGSTSPADGEEERDEEEKWLSNYLVLCKNRMEKAKTGLDLYFRLRNMVPIVFQERDASTQDMESSFATTCLAYLPQLTEEGHRVVVYTHFSSEAALFDPIALARRIVMMLDIQLTEGIQHTGVLLLTDLQNSRRGHLARYPMSLLNKMLTYGWKAYPERLAGVHILNPPPFLEMALAVFRPFIKEKLRERIKVHPDLKSLQESLSPKILPADYGGAAPPLQQLNRDWQKKMLANREWLEEAGKHRSKEELRPKDSRLHQQDILEDGSFRKLNID